MEYPPESARANGDELSRFIRAQAAQGELITWTVVLVSSSKVPEAKRRAFAGQWVGLIKREPASQQPTDYALRKANILSPRDESIDLSSIYLDANLVAQLVSKPALMRDRDFLLDQSTSAPPKNLREIALTLTQRRSATDSEFTEKKAKTDIPNGHIVRELRPKTHGLLLIYPLEQPEKIELRNREGTLLAPVEETSLDPAGDPIIGLVLSFPESETAARVEYQVNKKWNIALQEDPSDDD
jgi:hypothetical protein